MEVQLTPCSFLEASPFKVAGVDIAGAHRLAVARPFKAPTAAWPKVTHREPGVILTRFQFEGTGFGQAVISGGQPLIARDQGSS
jgi:hypothetical protein